MLKCNVKAKTAGLFHSYSSKDEKGECGTKTSKGPKKKGQKLWETELFSTGPQQVANGATQESALITMNYTWCLYLWNFVICLKMTELF